MLYSLVCIYCNKEYTHKNKNSKSCSKECSYKIRAITRNKKHEPELKNCNICCQVFEDTTLKKTRISCESCIKRKIVNTRRNNLGGNYHSKEWTEEHIRRMKERGSWGNSPDQIERARQRMKNLWALGKDSDLYRGENHWTKSDEGKQKISNWKKGIPLSDFAKQNMSISASKRAIENPNSLYTRGRGGYREDLGSYFRSEWEAAYARYLNDNNVKWEYEPKVFELSDLIRYIPDFYLPDTNEWVEVKGWWSENSLLKVQLFLEKFPEEKLVIIDAESYNLIEKYIKL